MKKDVHTCQTLPEQNENTLFQLLTEFCCTQKNTRQFIFKVSIKPEMALFNKRPHEKHAAWKTASAQLHTYE